MAPDINSLSNLNTGSGSSRLTNTRPMAHINIDAPPSSQNGDGDPSPSPRSPSTSLQAAATLNAGLQRGEPVRNMRPRTKPPRLRTYALLTLEQDPPAALYPEAGSLRVPTVADLKSSRPSRLRIPVFRPPERWWHPMRTLPRPGQGHQAPGLLPAHRA